MSLEGFDPDSATLSGVGRTNTLDLPSTVNALRIGGSSGLPGQVVAKNETTNKLEWDYVDDVTIPDNSISGDKLKSDINIDTTGTIKCDGFTDDGNALIKGNLEVEGNFTYDGDLTSEDITFYKSLIGTDGKGGTQKFSVDATTGNTETEGTLITKGSVSVKNGATTTILLSNTTGIITATSVIANSFSCILGNISFSGTDQNQSLVFGSSTGDILGNTTTPTVCKNLDLSDASNIVPTDANHEDIIFYKSLEGKNGDGGTQTFYVDATTGNITKCGTIASGDITATGTILATGNITSNATISCADLDASATISAGGNITSGATISCVDLDASATITATGNITSQANMNCVNLTTTGNIDCDANIEGATADIIGQLDAGSLVCGAISGTTGTFSSNISAVNGTFSGDISAVNETLSGNITAVDGTFSGNVSITGDITYDGDFKTEDLTIFKSLTMTNGDGGGSTATWDATTGNLTLGGTDSVAGDGDLSMPFGFISATATGGTSATGHSFSDSVWFRKDIEFTNSLSKVKMGGAGSELDMTTSSNSKILGYTSGYTECKNLDLTDTSNKFPEAFETDKNTYVLGVDPPTATSTEHAGGMTDWQNLLGYTAMGNRITNGDLTFTATGSTTNVRMYFEVEFWGDFDDGAWYLGLMEIDPDGSEVGMIDQTARVIFQESTAVHSGFHHFMMYAVLTNETEYIVAPYIFGSTSSTGTQATIRVGGNTGITDPTDSSTIAYSSYRIKAQPNEFMNASFRNSAYNPA